jgi:5-methyltetrahydropteroyltriglutamate--homocysteine methyltransferase
MRTTVVGNYPKIPSKKDGINLRRAINDFEKGKCSESQLEDVYRETIVRTINDQQRAGVDIITDGQIRWMELTYPMATSLISVHPGGLRRFYNNNVYYRRPQITGLMSRNKDIVTDEFLFASQQSNHPVKAVLCGPITFCDLADNYYYKSFDKLAEATAEILKEEVRSLTGAGCRYIQFDEPSLPLYPSKMALASDLYSTIFDGANAEYGLVVYFNSIKPIARELFNLPVKYIGLDLVSHPEDVELLHDFDSEKDLIAGLFDGRNIMLENEKKIRSGIDHLASMISPDRIILSPSCGLEFLPQKHALAKLNRMCEVAQKLTPVKTR